MDGSRSLYRFHPRATTPAPEGTEPLKPDVRASGCRDDGKRYLFRPGQLLVPAPGVMLPQFRRLADALEEEGAVPWEDWSAAQRLRERTYPEVASEHQRTVGSAKEAALDALAASGLAAAGLQRLVIPRLAVPDNDEEDDIPDVLDRLYRIWRNPGTNDDQSGATSESTSDADGFPIFPVIVMTGEDDDGVYGPALPVQPLAKDLPPLRVDERIGEGIRVAVIDTGVRKDHFWLKERCEARDLLDEEVLDSAPPHPQLDFEAGHGTFIAGVIRQFAPGATLVMRGVVDSQGIIDDAILAGAIYELENALPLHIVNLSLGGYIHNPLRLGADKRTELTIRDTRVQSVALPATAKAIDWLRNVSLQRHGIRLVFVAAAGNNGIDEPFYPAALDKVVGVGALNQDYSKPVWSNYGGWVNAWEIGADVTSSFVGPHASEPGGGGSNKRGAIWSGTSFAAPRYAGELAAGLTV